MRRFSENKGRHSLSQGAHLIVTATNRLAAGLLHLHLAGITTAATTSFHVVILAVVILRHVW
jgi:hypothetical protein